MFIFYCHSYLNTYCFDFIGWQDGNPHYAVSVGGKIACKTTTVKSVLMSSSAQFGPNHSIEFTVSLLINLI